MVDPSATPPIPPPRKRAVSPDNNWRSTKLGLAVASMVLITFAYAKAGEGWSEQLFGEYGFLLLGAVGIYAGGNVLAKRGTK